MHREVALGLAASLVVLALGAAPVAAQEDGETLFRANCAGCHGADGAGVPGVFPPLVDNPNVADAEYVRGVIRDGRTGRIEVKGVTYDGQMPAFPNLSDAEVDAIVDHVQNGLVAPSTDTTLPPVAITPIAEDAAFGRRLFLGQQRLANGGPACAACHAAGRHGDLVGVEAGAGPDLTDVWATAAGADAVVESLRDAHGAAMSAVYRRSPLTTDEIGALAAYLEAAGTESAATVLDGLVLIALAVLGLLVATTTLVVSGRRERGAVS
jgi:cbb3-type cytochrome c oxidase subunit III